MVTIIQKGNAGPARAIPWSCPAEGASLFDVYEPSGRYVSQVQIPARLDRRVVRGDFLWAITCSDEDVPSVGRYRILWR